MQAREWEENTSEIKSIPLHRINLLWSVSERGREKEKEKNEGIVLLKQFGFFVCKAQKNQKSMSVRAKKKQSNEIPKHKKGTWREDVILIFNKRANK